MHVPCHLYWSLPIPRTRQLLSEHSATLFRYTAVHRTIAVVSEPTTKTDENESRAHVGPNLLMITP